MKVQVSRQTLNNGLISMIVVMAILAASGCGATGTEEISATEITPTDVEETSAPVITPPDVEETSAPGITPADCDQYLDSPDPLDYSVGGGEEILPAYVENHIVVTEPTLETGSGGTIGSDLFFTYIDSVEVSNDYSVSLYSFDDDALSVWQMVLYILTQYSPDGERYAEPNYILGLPYDIEGSPYDIEGSAGGVTPAQGNLEDSLWDQWAFSMLNLQYTVREIQQAQSAGSGVTVAVFDSSPFNGDGYKLFELNTNFLGMCVRSLYADNSNPSTNVPHLKDHGLAVAGLVHALAPASKIHLVQVLNNEVKGDFYRLIKGMAQFLDKHLELEGDDNPPPMVFNLSLGFRPVDANPPSYIRLLFALDRQDDDLSRLNDELPQVGKLIKAIQGYEIEPPSSLIKLSEANQTTLPGALDTIRTQIGSGNLNDQICQLEEREEEPVPVCALRFVLDIASDRGTTIVAAAGNEAAISGRPLTAQLPALWENVISVGALNKDGDQSCYSNDAEFYSPGADGGPDPTPGSSRTCVPLTEHCISPGQSAPTCPYGIISLMTGEPSTSSEDAADIQEAYGFWVGTSFATPLISGYSAFLLSGDVQANDIKTTLTSRLPIPTP